MAADSNTLKTLSILQQYLLSQGQAREREKDRALRRYELNFSSREAEKERKFRLSMEELRNVNQMVASETNAYNELILKKSALIGTLPKFQKVNPESRTGEGVKAIGSTLQAVTGNIEKAQQRLEQLGILKERALKDISAYTFGQQTLGLAIYNEYRNKYDKPGKMFDIDYISRQYQLNERETLGAIEAVKDYVEKRAPLDKDGNPIIDQDAMDAVVSGAMARIAKEQGEQFKGAVEEMKAKTSYMSYMLRLKKFEESKPTPEKTKALEKLALLKLKLERLNQHTKLVNNMVNSLKTDYPVVQLATAAGIAREAKTANQFKRNVAISFMEIFASEDPWFLDKYSAKALKDYNQAKKENPSLAGDIAMGYLESISPKRSEARKATGVLSVDLTDLVEYTWTSKNDQRLAALLGELAMAYDMADDIKEVFDPETQAEIVAAGGKSLVDAATETEEKQKALEEEAKKKKKTDFEERLKAKGVGGFTGGPLTDSEIEDIQKRYNYEGGK